MIENFSLNYLDIITTLLGLAYILLEYKASIWLWLVGFIMQALDIILYYDKGLYADCGMEFYYIAMTIYGFLAWRFGKKDGESTSKTLPITHFKKQYILPGALITITLWAVIYIILVKYTDSTVPLADSFTTAFSFIALWALARKYLEQWLLWIVVDIVTFALYFYKGLPFKSGLYALYVVIAVMGYMKWRSMMHAEQQEK